MPDSLSESLAEEQILWQWLLLRVLIFWTIATQNHPRLFRVFIYAPFEARYRNCVENLHMEPQEAQKMIIEVDKARTAYHLRYAKYVPDDIQHNELLIDSSVLGIDGTAKYLSEFILQRLSIS